jgi:hypothetical protein
MNAGTNDTSTQRCSFPQSCPPTLVSCSICRHSTQIVGSRNPGRLRVHSEHTQGCFRARPEDDNTDLDKTIPRISVFSSTSLGSFSMTSVHGERAFAFSFRPRAYTLINNKYGNAHVGVSSPVREY